MTAPVLASQLLDARAARRLTSEIRSALAVADDLLARAYTGRAWEVLGHKSWEAYCAAELPELRHLKMRKPERLARARQLVAAGASTRELAAATGSSVGQAHNDMRELTGAAGAPSNSAPVSVVNRIVALLAAHPAGLTARQVEARTRLHHGQASAALTRLHQAGRIDYVRPVKRGQTGLYVTR